MATICFAQHQICRCRLTQQGSFPSRQQLNETVVFRSEFHLRRCTRVHSTIVLHPWAVTQIYTMMYISTAIHIRMKWIHLWSSQAEFSGPEGSTCGRLHIHHVPTTVVFKAKKFAKTSNHTATKLRGVSKHSSTRVISCIYITTVQCVTPLQKPKRHTNGTTM